MLKPSVHQNICRRLREKLLAVAAGTIRIALIKGTDGDDRKIDDQGQKENEQVIVQRSEIRRERARLGLKLASNKWLYRHISRATTKVNRTVR